MAGSLSLSLFLSLSEIKRKEEFQNKIYKNKIESYDK